jgi:hypothetical protein
VKKSQANKESLHSTERKKEGASGIKKEVTGQEETEGQYREK